jgi:adenylate cyclase
VLSALTMSARRSLRGGARAIRRRTRPLWQLLRHCQVRRAGCSDHAQARDRDFGERELSVLFVDIRGFTSFAQDRSATEIFATVSRFTTQVSAIVRRHGGRVVAFNGDGVAALFGVSGVLREKERHALAAGWAIVTELLLPAKRAPSVGLSVGVGIATGTDFVGYVQMGDHVVWTAIGNTANLAARLQGLSRDLDAAIVIDRSTRAACGEAAARLQCRRNVPIRGRRNTEDVFILPRVCLDGLDEPLPADTLTDARRPDFAQARA